MGPRRDRRTGPRAGWLCLALLTSGCSSARPSSPTMATVPPEWRNTNPWGPAANAARAQGLLRPLSYTRQMAAWREFGREHIQEGDILFRYGSANRLSEKLADRILTGIATSRFTHDSIAHWEDGTLYVFDTQPEPEGVRKIPFEFWMLDVVDGRLVVKRLKPSCQRYIPAALAFIQDAYEKQVPFDPALKLDDERLYCTEMIEKAFRSAGLALSDPIPIRCLPRYRRYSFLRPLVERFTEIRVDEPVFAPGNQYFGVFASPCLCTVYDAEGTPRCHYRPRPPRCPPVPYREPGPGPAPVTPPPPVSPPAPAP